MKLFAKSYELPISRDYCRHWGMPEAVRELLQNAIDSESPFEYEFAGDVLVIRSRHARLTTSTLLLGATSKAERQDAIGSFGEGYKIAMLVLVRSGYRVRVLNGDRVWTPGFRHSNQFDAEVLCVTDESASESNEGVAFEVSGLSPADEAAIRAGCLQMQGNVGELMTTPKGRILRERPGKLYVGGLFVCDTDMAFGYDVKPEFLKLERDRQTVSSFDLKWLAKDMWFTTRRYDEIAKMLEDDVPDMEHADSGTPELVKEACYQLFQARHPGKVAAKNRADLEELVKSGMIEERIVTVGSSYACVIRSSPSYRSTAVAAKLPLEPAHVLRAWLRANRSEMRSKSIEAFKELVDTAGKWVAK